MEPKEDEMRLELAEGLDALLQEAQGSTPPWMHAAKDMGVTFAPAEQPPWLLAAVEQGVVFYDPEGREIEVPASQVLAFNEALSKVRDFEETWQSTAGSDHSEKQDSTEAEGATESASQRRDLKAFVQKIYFKLLREGVEPNEAAAQAILQAAGQQQGQEQQQGQQGQDQQKEQCVAPAPLGGQQSCSLSASGKSGQTGKEVTVFA